MRRLLLFLFFVVSPVWASNGFVQGNSTQHESSASTTCAVTLAGTGSGNLLFFEAQLGATTAGTPSDGHNTWILVRGPDTDTHGNTFYSWFAVNSTSGSLTPTTTYGANTFNMCFFEEFSGLGGSPTAHTGAFSTQGSGTSWDTGAATISAGDLIIGYGGSSSTNPSSCTAGSGYTVPAGAAGGQFPSGAFACVEYNLSAPGGSTHATWTLGSAANGGMTEIAFTPTGAAANPNMPPVVF